MRNIRYKIWAWGDPTREGSCEQFNVGVCTKAKRSLQCQFAIANEMLCLRLAHLLKLPVPAGGIVDYDGNLWFTSLEYSIAEETLSKATNADIDAIVSDEWLACGIVVFDAWIVNEDRTKSNIRYNRDTKETYLIDHEKAFFYGPSSEAAVRDLESYRDKLVVNHNTNCVAKRLTALRDFAEWHLRIKAIPEYFIQESVNDLVELGLPESQRNYCVDYLLDRRDRLKTLFHDNYRTAFPRLPKQDTLFESHAPFAFERGDFDYSI